MRHSTIGIGREVELWAEFGSTDQGWGRFVERQEPSGSLVMEPPQNFLSPLPCSRPTLGVPCVLDAMLRAYTRFVSRCRGVVSLHRQRQV
mmetsp:Transcript_100910/g.289651  ORF Transcript_100910/g.289651 Transcript_100910/m.289651 type:complete len:90 (+) Transcript_100910:1791-2060(+)